MGSRNYDGLTPEEIAEEIVMGVEREFVQATAQLLIDRLNKILTTDDITVQFLAARLDDTIATDLYNTLLKYSSKITQQIEQILDEAILAKTTEEALQAVTGHTPSYSYTKGFNDLLQALKTNCTTIIRRQNVSLINNQANLWYQVSDRAVTQKLLQSQTPDKIIKEAVQTLAPNITKVTYTSGSKISIDAGIRRHINSQVGQVWNEVNETRAQEYNWDLFMCSSHAMCRPEHYEFQGRIFSKALHIGETIDGHKVRDYQDMMIGSVTGIYGANCNHFTTVYIPSVSKLQTPPYDAAENARQYGYSQKQRAMERNIRNLKSELKIADTQETRMKLNHQRARLRTYCSEHDLTRRYDLEKCYL